MIEPGRPVIFNKQIRGLVKFNNIPQKRNFFRSIEYLVSREFQNF